MISRTYQVFMHGRNVPSVVLFDGVCNLCNASVNFLIDHDKKNLIKYASLQSPFGMAQLEKYQLQNVAMDTVIIIQNNKAYVRSEGVLRVVSVLESPYWLASIFLLIPSSLSDIVYNLIGGNRYRLFGKSDECRRPTPELKSKFLD